MRGLRISIFAALFCLNAYAQSDLQPLFDTDNELAQAIAQNGMKSAFLQFLGDDAVIFQPQAINGHDFWKRQNGPLHVNFVRKITYADVAANGLLGYTTGSWRLYPKGKSESEAEFGQYVTIWEKKQDGKFRAVLDIRTRHEKLPFLETDRQIPTLQTRDLNEYGWSPADASLNFLKLSMSGERLGGAYDEFAAKDVRLLRDGLPPIIGKKNVVSETKRYISMKFPRKVTAYQSADLAYIWNPCEFADSNEGMEQGNCLHIWKLRDKKWWIVLGVFARVPNETPPVLNTRQERKKTR